MYDVQDTTVYLERYTAHFTEEVPPLLNGPYAPKKPLPLSVQSYAEAIQAYLQDAVESNPY